MSVCVVNTCFFLLFICFFMHASSALPNPISHHTDQKIEDKLKFKKFGPNERVTFVHTQATTDNLCNKNKPIKAGGTSRKDCKSSLHKALLQVPKPEDSRSPNLNVREKDLQYSSIFSDHDLSETADYHPPHRKSPIHNK